MLADKIGLFPLLAQYLLIYSFDIDPSFILRNLTLLFYDPERTKFYVLSCNFFMPFFFIFS
jgi:hypothetical protein